MKKRPSFAEHGVINRVEDSLFGYQGWPSVAVDENGTLYAVSSSFRLRHVCPFGKTAMYVSRNGGKTWTPPIVINDTYLDDRDAGILYMGNGRLLVTWFAHPASVYLNEYAQHLRNFAPKTEGQVSAAMLDSFAMLPEESVKGGSFIRISEDYGVTWGKTIQIPVSAPHGPSMCADGTLICLGKEQYAPEGTEEKDVIAAYASTDGGYTWERRGKYEKPAELSWDHFHEPHVIELDNGTLLGMIRAQGDGVYHRFTICQTESTDGGRTWSVWRCLNISGSPPHLLRLRSGALICSYGRREAPFGERALVSYDNGKTWEDDVIIDDRSPNDDLGYPASVELADGSILTVYYQRYYHEDIGTYDEKPSILYTRWKL